MAFSTSLINLSDYNSANSDHMQIFYFVTNYPPNKNNLIQPVQYIKFTKALDIASRNKKIIDSRDFLRFMTWWFSQDPLRKNIFDNSSLGVVQQFRGLLTQEESEYINDQLATWYGGVPLRHLLQNIINHFPQRNTH
jgi:hypothetical protein